MCAVGRNCFYGITVVLVSGVAQGSSRVWCRLVFLLTLVLSLLVLPPSSAVALVPGLCSGPRADQASAAGLWGALRLGAPLCAVPVRSRARAELCPCSAGLELVELVSADSRSPGFTLSLGLLTTVGAAVPCVLYWGGFLEGPALEHPSHLVHRPLTQAAT